MYLTNETAILVIATAILAVIGQGIALAVTSITSTSTSDPE